MSNPTEEIFRGFASGRKQLALALQFAVIADILACAESGGAEIFLTTDDQLLRLAERVEEQLKIRVRNPLTWLKEIMET